MLISNNFNRFYRAIIQEVRDKLYNVCGDKEAYKEVTANAVADALKMQNENYPRDENGNLLSTAKVTSKELTEHLEFIRVFCGERGITLNVDDEEWEREMKKHRWISVG